MNHLAFALPQESALFSGDHVMAWSTSVIAPPDGVMGHYMTSLDKLLARDEGHGGPVKEPQGYLRALIRHRRAREKSILARTVIPRLRQSSATSTRASTRRSDMRRHYRFLLTLKTLWSAG
jgi:glyoxylase-like metal-dependent hydrolase (beta-lactamase superfamily II)